MKLISVKMPEALIDGMDELIKKGVYPSRSALMRTAVRDLLRKELWSNPREFKEIISIN
jgi:antitoxin ParD1/3/4